jgi:hypothetical protein
MTDRTDPTVPDPTVPDPTAPDSVALRPQDADPTRAVPTGETQHLPAEGTGSAGWTTWVPASEQRPPSPPSAWSPPPSGATWTPPPVPPTTPAPMAPSAPARAPKPHVTYLPPPSGPNWGLVIVGLVFGLVGAGVVANQLTGFQVSSLSEMGPSVLVIGGLACAFLGMVGILARRRRG